MYIYNVPFTSINYRSMRLAATLRFFLPGFWVGSIVAAAAGNARMAAKGAAHLDVLGWGQGGRRRGRSWELVDQAVYPLGKTHITMENHHFFMGNSTINGNFQ